MFAGATIESARTAPFHRTPVRYALPRYRTLRSPLNSNTAETRSGALNEPRFHHRFSGNGVYADLLMRRFGRAARQWGLDQNREGLDCTRFAVPDALSAPVSAQMSLF